MADRLFRKEAYSIYELNNWRNRKQVDVKGKKYTQKEWESSDKHLLSC